MEFTEKTKLTDILDKYPWLEGELIKDEKVAAFMSNPLAKMMLKRATLKDASTFSGVPVQELIDELTRLTAGK